MRGWLLLASLGALTACDSSQTNSAQLNEEPATASPSWQYEESVDEMRNRRHWTATLVSSNAPQLDFPYEGGSPITLELLRWDNPPDSFSPTFALQNGQFNCHGSSNACYVTVKFDDNPPEDVRAVKLDCGSDQCLRLFRDMDLESGAEPKPILDSIREAKTLIVEAPLYQYGAFQYRFAVAGLNWPSAAEELGRREKAK